MQEGTQFTGRCDTQQSFQPSSTSTNCSRWWPPRVQVEYLHQLVKERILPAQVAEGQYLIGHKLERDAATKCSLQKDMVEGCPCGFGCCIPLILMPNVVFTIWNLRWWCFSIYQLTLNQNSKMKIIIITTPHLPFPPLTVIASWTNVGIKGLGM